MIMASIVLLIGLYTHRI